MEADEVRDPVGTHPVPPTAADRAEAALYATEYAAGERAVWRARCACWAAGMGVAEQVMALEVGLAAYLENL